MAKAAAIKPESAPPMLTLSDPFARFGRNNQWIVLGLLLLMGFVVFNEFLRFDALFFYKDIASDSINFNYSVLAHNTRYTAAYGFPSWSFEFGMGQNAFIFTLFDPLDYLLYPLGLEKARALMGYKVFFEVVLSGFIFYHFLRKLQLQYLTAILGALMYAFSGFMIVSSSWFIFSVEVLTLALLLLSFEMIYQKNQYWLFPLPIIYIILSRPFVLATLALFMLTYTIGLFDVVEHIEADLSFLKSIHTLLQAQGHVFISVPAYQALWSKEDDDAGHFRRYTRANLEQKLRDAGFEIVYSTYIFSLLILPVFLFRTIPSRLGLHHKAGQSATHQKEHAKPGGLSQQVLNAIWRFELKKIQQGRSLPFGGSVLVVARKK